MGGSKAKPVQTPFQQTQQTQNTFSPISIRDTKEAEEFLGLPLNFGGNNYGGNAFQGYGNAYKDYSGDAYKDIKNDFKFNIDPGVGRRTDLGEQEVGLRYDSAFMSGVPAWIRNMNRAREVRDVQGQGAAEAQQAEYMRQNAQQQADYQSSLARAQMRDASELNRARFRDESELNRAQGLDAAELNRARMLDQATQARTMADLERRRLLLPNIVQTGGSGSSSGHGTQLTQPQQGFWSSFGGGLGSGLGSSISALPFI